MSPLIISLGLGLCVLAVLSTFIGRRGTGTPSATQSSPPVSILILDQLLILRYEAQIAIIVAVTCVFSALLYSVAHVFGVVLAISGAVYYSWSVSTKVPSEPTEHAGRLRWFGKPMRVTLDSGNRILWLPKWAITMEMVSLKREKVEVCVNGTSADNVQIRVREILWVERLRRYLSTVGLKYETFADIAKGIEAFASVVVQEIISKSRGVEFRAAEREQQLIMLSVIMLEKPPHKDAKFLEENKKNLTLQGAYWDPVAKDNAPDNTEFLDHQGWIKQGAELTFYRLNAKFIEEYIEREEKNQDSEVEKRFGCRVESADRDDAKFSEKYEAALEKAEIAAKEAQGDIERAKKTVEVAKILKEIDKDLLVAVQIQQEVRKGIHISTDNPNSLVGALAAAGAALGVTTQGATPSQTPQTPVPPQQGGKGKSGKGQGGGQGGTP
ncbi:MAG: hypothetical protein AAB343_00395 [Patescibacteria group bacterium]